MSFSIELTKNGKSTILLKNHKYRESYSLKSGEVVWRCLGKNCGATVKTDAEKTIITLVNKKHSGPHPVTMRTLTPQIARNSLPVSVSPAAEIASPSFAATSPCSSHRPSTSTPCIPIPTLHPPARALPATSTLSAALHSPAATSLPSALGSVSQSAATCSTLLDTSPTRTSVELEAENGVLRDQITQLRAELKCVLDHSIESDQRLLEYTDEVFVARKVTPTCTIAADRALRLDEPAGGCPVEQCAGTRDLVNSLKTTVEVLEAENLLLKSEALECRCRGQTIDDGTWIPYTRKNQIPTQNRFQVLTEKNNINKKQNTIRKTKKEHKINFQTQARSEITVTENKSKLPFFNVHIEGDSHARHVAGLVQRLVTAETRVTGMCKPGAGLLSVTADTQPTSPESCSVLFAGTNDISAGDHRIIYQHLEQHIVNRTSTAKVVVSTIPHRHDLPADDPIHQQTTLANNYIEELCARHARAELLDLNTIGRRHFTRHGMHLTLRGKRLLAGLVLRSLTRVGKPAEERSPPPPPATVECRPPSIPEEPRCLPHDSYADAVKTPIRSPVSKNISTSQKLSKG